MSRVVRFSVAARVDIDEYAEFIAVDSPQAARLFIQAARRTADGLRTFPKIGAELVLPRLRLRGVRRMPIDGFPRHLLIYVVRRASVDVLCVTHGARDLPRVLRRLLRERAAREF